MADTAALVVALSAQLTKFERDMKQAYDIADKGVDDIEQRFKSANISLGGKVGGEGLDSLISALKTVAAAGGLTALIQQVTALNEAVAKIGEGAARVGATTDEFQKLRFAFVATGSSVEVAESFLDTFSRKVAEAATGTGALYNFLRVNNIEAAQFAKLPINEQISRYADLVKGASTNNQIFISSLVSSRQSAAAVTDALKDGRNGLQEFGEEAVKAGVVIDKSLIERAQKANKEFQILKLQATTVLQEFALGIQEQFKKQSQQNVENNKQLVEGWYQFYYLVKDTFPELVSFIKSGFREIGTSIEDAAKLRAGAQRQSNFEAGKQLLMQGQGSQLTDKQMGAFPGYTPAKTTNDELTKTYNEQAEQFRKLIEQQQKRNQLLLAEAQTMGQTIQQQTEYKTEIALLNDVTERNIRLTPQMYQQIREVAKASGEAAQAAENARARWQGLNSAAQFFGDQMITVFEGLTQKTMTLNDALQTMTRSIIRALLQASLMGSGPLGNLLGLGPSSPGGTGGLLGALVGAIPKQAGGGSVSGGHPYVVGERGPELFVPSSSGNIVPNHLMGGTGRGGTVVEINNYVSAETETKQRTVSEGPTMDRVVVDIVRKAQAAGEFDSVNRGRFGLRPNKVR